MDRELRPCCGKPRILEHDDAPDQVDALFVELPDDRLRVVVAARRTDRVHERHRPRCERDVASLVLDVELDRVQALVLELGVLGELPRKRRQRSRDMDPPDLDR